MAAKPCPGCCVTRTVTAFFVCLFLVLFLTLSVPSGWWGGPRPVVVCLLPGPPAPAAPSMDLGASLGRRARLWLPTCQEAGVQSVGMPGATMVSGL